MNILFLITDLTGHGGTERTTSLLANLFVKKGYKVTIASLFQENRSNTYDIHEKIGIIYLTTDIYKADLCLFYRLRLLFKAYSKLFSYAKNQNHDLIIGQGFLPNLLLWATGKSHKSIACEHYKYNIYSQKVRRLRNYIYKSFKAVVTLTNNDAEKFRRKGVRATVIPNMIPFLPQKKREGHANRIISVGRLHPQKGYDLLLPALKPVFSKYPNWHMDIYGDGPDRCLLENLRKDLNLQSNVFFKGFCSNIQQEYLKSSFYVMSSRFEGFPMTLLESLACGLPVISFNCPEGPADLLKDKAGYLVEPGQIDRMSEAIIQLIEDEKLRDMYAENGLAAVGKYTPDEIYKKWQLLFDCLK